MKIYEITFEIYGYTEWNYILANNIYQVIEWLDKNSKYEITKIEELGNCLTIIDENNG